MSHTKCRHYWGASSNKYREIHSKLVLVQARPNKVHKRMALFTQMLLSSSHLSHITKCLRFSSINPHFHFYMDEHGNLHWTVTNVAWTLHVTFLHTVVFDAFGFLHYHLQINNQR